MKNASNPQTFCDLNEHLGVFDIDYLRGFRLSDIQSKPKNVRVGLAEVDEAGRNKRIHKPVQLEFSNPIRIQFPCFVADHDNLQSILCFKAADQLDHFGIWLRLGEHKFLKLSLSKRSLLVEHYTCLLYTSPS